MKNTLYSSQYFYILLLRSPKKVQVMKEGNKKCPGWKKETGRQMVKLKGFINVFISNSTKRDGQALSHFKEGKRQNPVVGQ